MGAYDDWMRRHSDGTSGAITEEANGTFLGRDLVPLGDPPVYQPRRYRTASLQEAFRAVDEAARDRGHVCTPECGEWTKLRMRK